MKKYVVEGLETVCLLCIEEVDGRKKRPPDPIFLVSSDGAYSGPCCAAHLAALIKIELAKEGKEEPKPAVVVAAVPASNGPAK